MLTTRAVAFSLGCDLSLSPVLIIVSYRLLGCVPSSALVGLLCCFSVMSRLSTAGPGYRWVLVWCRLGTWLVGGLPFLYLVVVPCLRLLGLDVVPLAALSFLWGSSHRDVCCCARWCVCVTTVVLAVVVMCFQLFIGSCFSIEGVAAYHLWV